MKNKIIDVLKGIFSFMVFLLLSIFLWPFAAIVHVFMVVSFPIRMTIDMMKGADEYAKRP